MEEEEIHVYVSGTVQGVGFRAQVQSLARKHGVHGYVRNLDDGKVEICAQKTGGSVEPFLEEVQKRPGSATIRSFDVRKQPASRRYSGFEIAC